jgi:hypothetical protein
MALKYTLKMQCLNNVEDAGVRWQIEGGDVFENEKKVGTYSNVKRVSCGTFEFNTAQVLLTLFFKNKKEGKAPENMTLHGANNFNTGNEIGSVSAASASFSAQIGKQFDRTNNVLVIG